MPLVYLDTSAFLRRFKSEPGSAGIRALFQTAEADSRRSIVLVTSGWTLNESAGVLRREHHKGRIVDIAKDYVKKFWNYPLDAEFPWFDYDVRRSTTTNEFQVSSTVKAKNAFGALLTHSWTVSTVSKAKTWELRWCKIGDEVVYANKDVTPEMTEAAKQGLSEFKAELKSADEEKRQAERAERKRIAEEKREKAAPATAASWVKTARTFLSQGNGDSAKRWLQKVVDQFPDTEAASEAKTLLEELEKN